MASSRRMLRLSAVVLGAFLALPVSGCIEAPLDDTGDGREVQPDHVPTGSTFDGEVYLLSYTLEDRSGETRRAPHGEHCSPASRQGDRIVLEQYMYDKIRGAEAALYVDPEWEGDWPNFGDGAYMLAVPGKIASPDVTETMLQFEWEEGALVVDGETVSAPKSWTKTAKDGSWRITATLQDGPEKIDVIEDRMCM